MKITIHAALAELKLIEAKINKKIETFMPIGIKQKGKKIFDIYDDAEFIKTAQADQQSINDLMQRRISIKCAIIASNAVTIVKINNKELTVAEAITAKEYMELKKNLLEKLKKTYNGTRKQMENQIQAMNTNIQEILKVSFGRDVEKVDPKDIDNIRQPFIDANEPHMVDPLNVEQLIKDLEESIMDFESQVDIILSESNAVTFIEI